MKSIAFLIKQNQPDAVSLCQLLIAELKGLGHSQDIFVIASPNEYSPLLFKVPLLREQNIPQDLGMLVVLGGDGTLLYGARLLLDRKTPILGINLGHLGFLSAGSRHHAASLLKDALSGALPIEERVRLCCQIYRPTEALPQKHRSIQSLMENAERREEYTVLNDIVLSQPAQARLFELTAFLDDQLITTYKADGLIVATPTGSTAYNLAAGGPILVPHLNGFVVTPICPHALTARPLVAPLSSCLIVQKEQQSDQVMVTIDGRPGALLESQDFVRIVSSDQPVRLFRTKQHSFFDLLRTKLHWGSRG